MALKCSSLKIIVREMAVSENDSKTTNYNPTMRHTRRTFIGSAITAAAGMGLTKPLYLLADGLTSAVGAGMPDASWRPAKGILTTAWTNQVTPDKAWPEYPRPQLARERWLNLNGLWSYRVTSERGVKRAPTIMPEKYWCLWH